MGNPRLTVAVLCTVLLAALALPASGQYTGELPPFIVEVRKAIVSTEDGGKGVLAGDRLVVTHAHGGPASTAPGTETQVVFFGYRAVTDPEGARSGLSRPDLNRRGRVVCIIRDIDIRWVELLEPPPEGVRPATLGGAMVSPLYFVFSTKLYRGAYLGERQVRFADTEPLSKRPAVQVLDGGTSVPGWSGTPVVNTRGEVVGLVSGGTPSEGVTILTGPVRYCRP